MASLHYNALDNDAAQIRVLRVVPWPAHDASRTASNELPHSFKLETINLDGKPLFAALSYVWGDATQRRTVIIEGVAVQVTQNLYDALSWHASNLSTLPLWADAICINQFDHDEKSHQIGLMSRIYREASKVICWPGASPTPQRIDHYLNFRIVLDFSVDNLLKNKRRAAFSALFSWAIMCVRAWFLPDARLEMLLIRLRAANGQNELCQLAYFSRMWTFQEVILPSVNKTVFVLDGLTTKNLDPREMQESMRLHKLGLDKDLVLDMVVREQQDGPESLKDIERQILHELRDPTLLKVDTYRMYSGRWGVLSERAGSETIQKSLPRWLLLLLAATSTRTCQDPRDKIFAVVGLLADHDEPSMEAAKKYLAVDYNKRPEDVPLDALKFIYKYEAPRAVAMVIPRFAPCRGALHQHQASYPSWMPDMSRLNLTSRSGFQEVVTGEKLLIWPAAEVYDTGDGHHDNETDPGQNRAKDPDDRAQNTLTFLGKLLGNICAVYVFPDDPAGVVEAVVAMLSIADELEMEVAPQHPNDKSQAAHEDGIIGEVISKIRPVSGLAASIAASLRMVTRSRDTPWTEPDHVVFWRSLARSRDAPGASPVSGSQMNALAGLTLTISRNEGAPGALVGQMLAVLDSGRFGLCPQSCAARVDDSVIAAPVFKRVMVLRPAAGDPSERTTQAEAGIDRSSVTDTVASESREADAQEVPRHTDAEGSVKAYLFVDYIDIIGLYEDGSVDSRDDLEATDLVEERITLI